MDAKYIVAELPTAFGTCMGPIVFPAYVEHSLVARALKLTEIQSAGFCVWDDKGKCHAYGKSVSLGVESHPEDSAMLNRLGGQQ